MDRSCGYNLAPRRAFGSASGGAVSAPHRLARALWLLLAVTFGAPGFAATYTVEMLVFARDDPFATDYLPLDPGIPDLGGAETLEVLGYPELNTLDGRLGPERYTLQKNGHGKLLLHKRWRQPVRARHLATRVRLSSGAPDPLEPPLLSGVISLGAGKFFHLDVDFVLRDPATQAAQRPRFSADEQEPGYQHYRLVAHRKMRAGRLHYIDHPKMGILVMVYR